MQSPTNSNEDHAWDNQPSHSQPQSPADNEEGEQATIIGQQDQQFHPPTQAGIIASNSDDLFYPTTSTGPTSNVFTLPNVPFNPNPQYHAYNRRGSIRSRPLPFPSPTSSYNNPSFVPPPPLPHALYNAPVSVNHSSSTPLGPPPPIPPRIRPQPVPNHIVQPVFPAYNQPFPVQIPAYNYNFLVNPSVQSPNQLFSSSPAVCQIVSQIVSSKTLPSVVHIPVLTSKLDFFAWDEGVTSLIRANGLIGHILDPSEPVDPNRPDRVPVSIPILPVAPSPHDIADLNRWWDDDNVAQHILVSRLRSIPRGLLPSANLVTRTALSIYKMLVQYYGTCSFADCTELMNSLHNTPCTNGRVQEYVSKWRTGISCLQSARFPFSIKICISQFVRGLPFIAAFTPLRADIPHRIATAGDQDFGAFITLTETVLELDTIFRTVDERRKRLHA